MVGKQYRIMSHISILADGSICGLETQALLSGDAII
jgi:hypothetical protein